MRRTPYFTPLATLNFPNKPTEISAEVIPEVMPDSLPETISDPESRTLTEENTDDIRNKNSGGDNSGGENELGNDQNGNNIG